MSIDCASFTRNSVEVGYDAHVSTDELTVTDGRHARRDRNRVAVIDAMFSLLDEGAVSPSTDAIAQRAGVSVSSLFRYFEGLDDLQEQTIERHFERFAPLFEIPSIGSGSSDARISGFVISRLALYRSIAPVARLARSRSLDQPTIAETLASVRAGFADQVRIHFSAELDHRTPAQRDDLVGLVDALTAFESWDLLISTHARSDRAIRRAWTNGIHRLLDPT